MILILLTIDPFVLSI